MHLSRRALAVSAMALAALTTASGCTATNAQTTAEVYSPGAAAATSLGVVHVAGLFVATDGEGPAALVARIVNSGDDAATVEISDQGDSGLRGSFTVEPASTLDVGPDGAEQVRVPSLATPPGAVLQMRVESGGESETLSVPVLDGTLEQYAPYVPASTPAGPSASPSVEVTSSPSATGTRTGSPSASASSGAASRTPSPGTSASDDESTGG